VEQVLQQKPQTAFKEELLQSLVQRHLRRFRLLVVVVAVQIMTAWVQMVLPVRQEAEALEVAYLLVMETLAIVQPLPRLVGIALLLIHNREELAVTVLVLHQVITAVVEVVVEALLLLLTVLVETERVL
jgi:hypothetical protein